MFKKSLFKTGVSNLRVILCLGVFVCAVFSFMLTYGASGVTQAAAEKTITKNEIGVHDGYGYELWKDNGTTNMTLKDGGAFSCSWSGINNALFRRGRKFDETKTHGQLGIFSVAYECDYKPNGNSYLCIYGWTVEPLVEYYIVESWGNWRPPGAVSKGTFAADGGTYDIYETTRFNQPSIKGTATFQQYWSVRTSKRESGDISVSGHFLKWESMGMNMGKMYETALTVEGYQSSGSANVTKNVLSLRSEATVTVNGGTYEGTPQSGQKITLTANEPPAGMYFDGWTVNGGGITPEPVDGHPLKAQFTMPFNDVTVTANYAKIGYTVTVNDGTHEGTPQVGETITLTAKAAPEGYEFDKWEVKYTDDGTVVTVSGNTFVMPSADVTATPIFKEKADEKGDQPVQTPGCTSALASLEAMGLILLLLFRRKA